MLIARCCAGRPAIWSHPRAISGTSQGGGTQCGHLAALEGHKDSLIACGVANDRTTSRGMGARKCMTLLAMGRTHWKDRLPAASMFLVSESEKDISLHGTIITTLLDRAELRQC